MTLLVDHFREHRNHVGPAAWREAWNRTIEVMEPVLPGRDLTGDGVLYADGGCALALTLYLIACRDGSRPGQVTRAQVDALLPRGNRSFARQSLEPVLREAGHGPDDRSDPVSALWQELWVDHDPGRNLPEEWHDDSTVRTGPRFLDGIESVLAPRWNIQF